MDKKISELTAATSGLGTDLIPIVQSGANKKLTIANLFGKVNTPTHFNESGSDIDFRISGDTDAFLFMVDASTDRIGIGRQTPVEKFDINGGLRINGIKRNDSVVTQTSSGVVDLTSDTTILSMAGPGSVTLGSGTQGQEKTVVADNVGPVTLTAASSTGFTNVVFDAAGDVVVFKYLANKWYIVGSMGATIT